MAHRRARLRGPALRGGVVRAGEAHAADGGRRAGRGRRKAVARNLVTALVPNLKGAAAAIEAGADAIVIPISVSEAHSLANVRRTPTEMWRSSCRPAGVLTSPAGRCASMQASRRRSAAPSRVREDAVVRVAQACVDAGAERIGLADTVGYANPAQVRRLFDQVHAKVGARLQFAHFHDTRGTGLANVVAALEAGIRSFDASLGGLGGCPHAPGASGNVATEDLVFMLEAMGFDTGINLDALLETQRRLAQWLPGQPLHGKVAGRGAAQNLCEPCRGCRLI